jgi:hypothetical protein
MMDLPAILPDGTRGTSPEPSRWQSRFAEKSVAGQFVTLSGTRGTCGTLENRLVGPARPVVEPAQSDDEFAGDAARWIEMPSDAYTERVAIIMATADISVTQAEATATARVGAEVVHHFVTQQEIAP